MKKQINFQTFQRAKQLPGAVFGLIEYCPWWSYEVLRSEAVYVDGFLYARIACRPRNKPVGCVKHGYTYARYDYVIGSVRHDKIVFFKREEE